MFYTIPILILFSSALFVCNENKKIAFIFFVFISFFCGLRYATDPDYFSYYEIFKSVPSLFENSFSFSVLKEIYGEYGFLISISIFKTIGGDFFIYTLIFSFCTYFNILFFYSKESFNPFFSFSLYILSATLIYNFIQIRYGLAISFVMLSFYFYRVGKLSVSILFILIASSFHTYILSVIPSFIIMKYVGTGRGYTKEYLLVVFIFIFTTVFINKLGIIDLNNSYFSYFSIFNKIKNYTDGDKYNYSINFLSPVFLKTILLLSVVYILNLKYSFSDAKYNFYLKLYFSMSIICSMLTFSPIFYGRFSIIVDCISFVPLSYLLMRISNIFIRYIMALLLFFVCFCFYFVEAQGIISEFHNYRSWLYLYF